LAEAAARLWAEASGAAVSARGIFRIALSGGRTPQALFRFLAEKYSNQLPWEKTELYWCDERSVPQDHEQSNYRLAREALLDRVAIPSANVHPVPTGSNDPKRDAAAYETVLRQAFTDQAWPALDLALLGLGADGHTASLFPGEAALLERDLWVSAARAPVGVPERITLTVPALNGSRLVVFLVAGTDKAQILRTVLTDRGRPPLPAQMIKPSSGRVLFLADQDAAARIKHRK